MKKIFFSFLGTNNYIPCNYEITGVGKVDCVKFVQEASIKLSCKDFSDQDKIIIFLTSEARRKNWVDNGHELRSDGCDTGEGLYTRLKELNCPAIIRDIDIPEGFTEDQIWEIFQIVYDAIETDCELIIDITHAFRLLPMLGMVIINYLRVLKNTKLRSIHYGALEAMGTVSSVKQKPIEDRNAVILDLTPFAVLQQWTNAANTFIRYGNAGEIQSLVNDYNSVKDNSLNKDILKEMRNLSKSLNEITKYFSTVRGKYIIDGRLFNKTRIRIEKIRNESFIKPLTPLLRLLTKKTEVFKEKNVLNGFYAIKWCLDHDLIQQGITILQEMIITLICEKYSRLRPLNYNRKADREFVSKSLNIIQKPQSSWEGIKYEDIEIIKQMHNSADFKRFSKIYRSFTQYRNNINHGGFVEDFKSNLFKTKLEEGYHQLKEILKLSTVS